jgi:hypothetical protein
MIITRKDITVESVLNENRPFWRLRINLPQLHMYSALTYTVEHAEEMADEISKRDECPHCHTKI